MNHRKVKKGMVIKRQLSFLFSLGVAGGLTTVFILMGVGMSSARTREWIEISSTEEWEQYLLDEDSPDYDLGGQYRLGADLDLTGYSWSIGTNYHPFTGKIDGDGHIVEGLERPMFGVTKGARIENLLLDQCSIRYPHTYYDGKEAVDGYAALIAYAVDTEVKACGTVGEIYIAEPQQAVLLLDSKYNKAATPSEVRKATPSNVESEAKQPKATKTLEVSELKDALVPLSHSPIRTFGEGQDNAIYALGHIEAGIMTTAKIKDNTGSGDNTPNEDNFDSEDDTNTDNDSGNTEEKPTAPGQTESPDTETEEEDITNPPTEMEPKPEQKPDQEPKPEDPAPPQDEETETEPETETEEEEKEQEEEAYYMEVTAQQIVAGGLIAQMAGKCLITECFSFMNCGEENAAATLEAEILSAGFCGRIGEDTRVEGSYASGLVDVSGVSAGFVGANAGKLQNCFTTCIMGEHCEEPYAFVGKNLETEEPLSGCIYDQQIAGAKDTKATGHSTIQIIGGESGLSGENWHYTEHAYPQIAYFVNHENVIFRLRSGASAIALVLPENTVLSEALQATKTGFALPTEVDGEKINWSADGVISITEDSRAVFRASPSEAVEEYLLADEDSVDTQE